MEIFITVSLCYDLRKDLHGVYDGFVLEPVHQLLFDETLSTKVNDRLVSMFRPFNVITNSMVNLSMTQLSSINVPFASLFRWIGIICLAF